MLNLGTSTQLPTANSFNKCCGGSITKLQANRRVFRALSLLKQGHPFHPMNQDPLSCAMGTQTGRLFCVRPGNICTPSQYRP
jgi:hypothetical protein